MSETVTPPRFRVNVPWAQGLKARAVRLALRAALVLVPLFFLRACLFTYVPPDQIGMRQVAFGPGKGLQKELVYPGYRRQVSGYEQVRIFPRNVQAVEFTNNPAETGAGHRKIGAIKVPTIDGYPVDVDVTVLYRIADPYLVVSRFGFGDAYEENVVVRFTDPLVKQYLGTLFAEQFYAEERLRHIHDLKVALTQRLKENGLALEDVLIRQYDYPETFQTLTEQKKVQDQKVLAERQIAKQNEVQTRLNQVSAEGQNLINVKTAEFQAQITEINAKQNLYERQKRAEADLLIKSAEAAGTEQINRAMEGAGSSKLLRLRRGLALLNSIKGPIYISEDPTDIARLAGGVEKGKGKE
ncbi:MAG TPA: SPFH domain-containing protein [Thermoanaerobaculia bacterium]|nr:SPFH domain-containing protein [Thermoanaerobaculia bacterium]